MAKPNKLKYTEEQLATVAVAHLQEMGYETYEEVHLGPGRVLDGIELPLAG